MLDRAAARPPDRCPAPPQARGHGGRMRALVACALAAMVLHALFLGGLGGLGPAIGASSAPPLSVRMVEAPPPRMALAPPSIEPAAADESAPPPAVVAVPRPRPPRSARAPAVPGTPASSPVFSEASADIPRAAPVPEPPPVEPPPPVAAEPTTVSAEAAASAAADGGEIAAAAGAATGAPPSLLAPGEVPPPIYATRLPPPVTLHYQVRRGFLRGTGTIRWQAEADRYRLVLEAAVAGLTLLTQTSEGAIDAAGLAPTRFVDQRARRSPQAANFRRDDGQITFSGSGVAWPLLAGSQDRLSWMIQLAGIAAAEPGRWVEGARIAMVVVGARGDASVWTLRCAGREAVATASGSVDAVKFVREGRGAYDTSAEIWLDPERHYLPAHATLRNSSGASEYDLLLDRIDAGP